MRTLFPNSFGIDHVVKRPKSQVICLDFQKPENQDLIATWVRDPRCVWVHFGVPCGTCSRARERRMARNNHGPPPLRNKTYPNGLPPHILSPQLLARLRAANRLYLFVQKLILSLPVQTVWTIENPLRSWFWQTIYNKKIANQQPVSFFQFDMCMFGGRRLKRTGIATNCKHLGHFALACDSQHDHAPYTFTDGKFDTASEAEYPLQFCRTLVQGVAEHLQQLHHWGPLNAAKRLKTTQHAAIATGTQPKRAPPLIPEFQAIRQVAGLNTCLSLPVDSKSNLTRCLRFLGSTEITIHTGNKLLRRTTKRGGSSTTTNAKQVDATVSKDMLRQTVTTSMIAPGNDCSDQGVQPATCGFCSGAGLEPILLDTTGEYDELVFGVFWDELQFLEQIAKAGHPQHLFLGVADHVEKALCANAVLTKDEMVIHRCRWLGKYIQIARELKEEEACILASMPESMRRIMRIMRTKRIALLQRMILKKDMRISPWRMT